MEFLNSKIIFKRLLCCLFSVFLLSGANLKSFSLDYSVTDRELLMLSIMSYYDKQNKDVSTISGGEDFDKSCFSGFASPSELKGWEVMDSVITRGINKFYGLSVVTYKKNNNVVVAFRGTDSGLFLENKWYLCPFIEHPQAKHAREYMEKVLESNLTDENSRIYLVGHSLGGYLVLNVLGNFYEREDFKSRFVKAVTFNGLGMGFMENRKARRILSNMTDEQIVNYRMEWDIVSLVGSHFTKMTTFKREEFQNTPLYKFAEIAFAVHQLYNFFVFDSFVPKSINRMDM